MNAVIFSKYMTNLEGFKDIVIDALMNGGEINEEMLEQAINQYKRNKRR